MADRIKPSELLAAYAHNAWSRWMRYVFEQGIEQSDGVLIPHALVERWKRQMETPYEQLPEDEKASDREEAVIIQTIFFGDGEDEKR
jgi:hypothetical protein